MEKKITPVSASEVDRWLYAHINQQSLYGFTPDHEFTAYDLGYCTNPKFGDEIQITEKGNSRYDEYLVELQEQHEAEEAERIARRWSLTEEIKSSEADWYDWGLLNNQGDDKKVPRYNIAPECQDPLLDRQLAEYQHRVAKQNDHIRAIFRKHSIFY